MALIQDKSKALTAEDLIRRYNLESLSSDRKKITQMSAVISTKNKILYNFVYKTTDNLNTLKNQSDNKIVAWFFNDAPSNNNTPTSDWIADLEQSDHVDDIYYCRESGKAYRYKYNSSVYSWVEETDSYIIESMALANSEPDTSDNKRVIFGTTPSPLYEVGDVWVDGTNIYRCRATRTEGAFHDTDWILYTEYSNEDYLKETTAVLDQFRQEVSQNYVTNARLETTTGSIMAEVTSNTTTMIEEATSDLATRTELQELERTVRNTITDSYSKTEVQEIISGTYIDEGGHKIQVSKAVTESGTFSNEGLRIQKEDGNGNIISKTTGLFNEKGVDIAESSSGNSILYAGYDDNVNSDTYGTSVVVTDNLRVKTYLRCGGVGRFEAYTDSQNNDGVGFFLEG